MPEINLDYARNLDLTIRRSGFVQLNITVLQDSLPYDFTGSQVQLMVFGNKFNKNPHITKSSGIDGDYVTITSNVITLKFWQDLTAINLLKYFWVLRVVDSAGEIQYWLVGDYKIISGASDEEVATFSTTISITQPTNNIYLNIFSGQGGVGQFTSIYSALVSQSGTSAPSDNALISTILPAPTWSRVSAGKYKLSISGGFDLAKTLITPVSGQSMFLTPNYVLVKFDTDNNILIETWNSNQELTDSILSDFPLRVEIFN